MRLSRLLLGLAVLTCLVVLGWQRSVRAGLRAKNEMLLASTAEVETLLAQNRELTNSSGFVRDDVDTASAELPLLRNEVRQLREQQQLSEKLRAENERLRADAESGASPARFSEKEGYLSREAWTNAGMGTPEAVVQTFFQALK